MTEDSLLSNSFIQGKEKSESRNLKQKHNSDGSDGQPWAVQNRMNGQKQTITDKYGQPEEAKGLDTLGPGMF